jgi:hypothetical protein
MLKNFARTEESEDKDETDGETKIVDPVRWYGLLAPQTLKDAQSRFIKGIRDSLLY